MLSNSLLTTGETFGTVIHLNMLPTSSQNAAGNLRILDRTKKQGNRNNREVEVHMLLIWTSFLLLLFMWYNNLKATRVVIVKMKEEAQQNIRRYTALSSHGKSSQRLIISSASTSMHANSQLQDTKEHGNLQTEQVMIGTAEPTSRNSDRTTTTEWQQLTENDIVTKTLSPYAYAWVVGGIHEDRPSYKGFLWTVIISAKLLRQMGSTADFWAYFRLSPNSKMKHLESTDMRVLEALGVNVVLLEKPNKESFAQLVYDKFLTINMTQYKRVMFLDADVLPMTNLDYYFHLSDPDARQFPTLLRPNFIVASRNEPCNTGMFMVEPSVEAFEEFKEVVRKQHQRAKALPYPHFDFNDGWGHNFESHGDYWEGISQVGTKWKFHAGHSDQGLMYYYAKYVRMDVSIAIGNRIQNWMPGHNIMENNTSVVHPIKESEKSNVLAPYQGKLLRYQFSCDDDSENDKKEKKIKERIVRWKCVPPYDSVAHFMGLRKPWRRSFDFKLATDSSKSQSGARYVWFKELQNISDEFGMGLDLYQWNTKYLNDMKDELLGELAQYHDILNATETFGIS